MHSRDRAKISAKPDVRSARSVLPLYDKTKFLSIACVSVLKQLSSACGTEKPGF